MKSALLALMLLAASGCGAKDPAAGLNFRPPAGWSTDARLLGVDVFASPGRREFMSLSTTTAGADLPGRLLDGATYRDPRQVDTTAIRVCGDREADRTTAVVFFISANRDMNLEMVTRDAPDGQVLVADYVYPVGGRPDPRAQAALRDLCPA